MPAYEAICEAAPFPGSFLPISQASVAHRNYREAAASPQGQEIELGDVLIGTSSRISFQALPSVNHFEASPPWFCFSLDGALNGEGCLRMAQRYRAPAVRLAGPVHRRGQGEETAGQGGVRMPKGGSDAENGPVFRDAGKKKKKEKKKEACSRLKREIPSKCRDFKLSLMCSLQGLRVHLQSKFLSPRFLLQWCFSQTAMNSLAAWESQIPLPTPRKLGEMNTFGPIRRKGPRRPVPPCLPSSRRRRHCHSGALTAPLVPTPLRPTRPAHPSEVIPLQRCGWLAPLWNPHSEVFFCQH